MNFFWTKNRHLWTILWDNPVVFKLCATLWGAVRNLQIFFDKMKYCSFSIEICLGVPRKIFGLFQGAASQKV
jgi:hypothetical protein